MNLRERESESVRLHSLLSRATVIAQLGHQIGLLSLFQYTCTGGELIIDRSMSDSIMVGGDMPPFSLLVLDLFPVDL